MTEEFQRNLNEGVLRSLEALLGEVRREILSVGEAGAEAFSPRANLARLKKLHETERHLIMAIRSYEESQFCVGYI